MEIPTENTERDIPEGFVRIEEHTLLEKTEATLGRITKYYSRKAGGSFDEVNQTQWTNETTGVFVNIEDCVVNGAPLDQAIFTTFDIFQLDDDEPNEARVKRLVIRNIEWGGDLKIAGVMEADAHVYDSQFHEGLESRFFQKSELRVPTPEEVEEFSALATTIEADLQRVEREKRRGYHFQKIAGPAIDSIKLRD